MLTLSCHNMEIKTTIGNRGFPMYTKNVLKWFAAFERVVSLQTNL